MLSGKTRPDLARIALEIVRDFDPEVDIEQSLTWIDRLAGRIRDRCPAGAGPRKVVSQINWAMFVEEGFRGNTDNYYDSANSYLNRVIERKTGIPITLCILYSAVAARLGVELPGLNLPAHFMLKLTDEKGTHFIDPFHGDMLDRDGCERRLSEIVRSKVRLDESQISPCPPALIVIRLLRNLKAIHLQEGDHGSVIHIQKRLALLLADDPRELRDLGLLYHHLGRLDEAIIAFDQYLELWGHEHDAEIIQTLRRNTRHEIILRN